MSTDHGDLGPLFEPIQVGSLHLRNRIMLPPHGLAIGQPWMSEQDNANNLNYWATRARDGVGWIGGWSCYVDNSMLIPGFENTGPGTTYTGPAHLPNFRASASQFVEAVRGAGAAATAQLIFQGALPHAASRSLANYINTQEPHALDKLEIDRVVEEFIFLATELEAAGMQGVELHACHEDLLHLFISPATNKREDEYGGDMEGRMRLTREVLKGIHEATADGFTVGMRFNVEEQFEGGYDLAEGITMARALQDEGLIDFLHATVGNNWGSPVYLQSHAFPLANWSTKARAYKEALDVPVIYTGRVSTVGAAAEVIGRGDADLVGMARAMFAEPQIVSKARSGRAHEIRPCIGTNDCLQRRAFDKVEFGCSVNPLTGHGEMTPRPTVARARKVLVAGAGPAGLELAALLADQGDDVQLWERDEYVGGQMRVAALAPENAAYADFIRFQHRRVEDAGVVVHLGREATPDAVMAENFDIVAVATGATSRRPLTAEGLDRPDVVDGWDAMADPAGFAGKRVVVIAQDDHMQPLTIAGRLVEHAADVHIVYQTPAIAPGVWKYSNGTPLTNLSSAGAHFTLMQRLVAITDEGVQLAQVYTGERSTLENADAVVLACGGTANSTLYDGLRGRHPGLHILGDAYAPRRIANATRQALALADTLTS